MTNNYYTVINPNFAQNKESKPKTTALKFSPRNFKLKCKNQSFNNDVEIEQLQIQIKEKNDFIKILIEEKNKLNDQVINHLIYR